MFKQGSDREADDATQQCHNRNCIKCSCTVIVDHDVCLVHEFTSSLVPAVQKGEEEKKIHGTFDPRLALPLPRRC